MENSLTVSELYNWNNPLIYFVLLLFTICLMSIFSVLKANQVIKEQGIQCSYDLYGSNIRNVLKWTSNHETKTGILMLILVMVGIIIAVNFKAN